MEEFLTQMRIQVNKRVFLKDPDTSEKGRKIISNSILLIDEIGFENFTFKKLGMKIGSPESTIYRYFENKHKILLYLTIWYWSWLEYRLVFSTININSPEEKLNTAIKLLVEPIKEDSDFSHINEVVLNRIVISESAKSYFTKDVGEDNKDGVFKVYKRLVQRVSDMVLAINPDFEYPNMLISTVVEGAHQQRHFAKYLPSLTNVRKGKKDITNFFIQMVFNTIQKK
ncbi:MAG: TetR/AcrR family transcriptional regulator [Cytophagales bacterium]|nr:TetR/AcrR family transcriptional regulator [Cytophagales bacterium]